MSLITDLLAFLGLGQPTVVDPFPTPVALTYNTTTAALNTCAGTASGASDVTELCAALVDLTSNPTNPPYAGHNDTDMLFVGSLAKIYAMYAAFELKKRVEIEAKKMISNGLSTATAGWENSVYAALKTAWQPKLNSAFPTFPSGFPKLADILVVSSTGDASFAESPLTDAQLDALGEFGAPQGKFRDWMRLMLRWSNNTATSRCVQALSFPYINGVLGSAGFFSPPAGLWLSADYAGHDWLPDPQKTNPAGQVLSARWATAQGRRKSNITGTARQIARFMTLLAQGKLVDSSASTEMISIMTGAQGIGSYIGSALSFATPARSFDSIASKIGFGDDSFSHDCAIVRVNRSGDPTNPIRYVAVILGSAPAKARAGLSKLAVAFHDCVVAQHP